VLVVQVVRIYGSIKGEDCELIVLQHYTGARSLYIQEGRQDKGRKTAPPRQCRTIVVRLEKKVAIDGGIRDRFFGSTQFLASGESVRDVFDDRIS